MTDQTLYICFTGEHADTYKQLYREKLDKMKSDNYFQKSHRDSGFDVFCPRKVECPCKLTTRLHLGISAAVYKHTTKGDIPMPYYMYPRSSISKTPLRLANSVGIIDSGYRGELQAPVDNFSCQKYIVEEGQRLFQICSGDLTPFYNVKIVDSLDQTDRGAGGFGSTGF